MYDIIIVGSGPAGLTSALYSCRAEKRVLVLEKETFGGQITYSPKVENYPGFLEMSGNEFAEKLLSQVLEQGAEIELETVQSITPQSGGFLVETDCQSHQSRSVILATGSKHRQLGLPKEQQFTGNGVYYCAVCDGAFQAGKEVCVIGGGNTALQDAVLLSGICKTVHIIQDLPELTGEQRLVSALAQKNNVTVTTSTVVDALLGEDAFSGVRLRNTKTGQVKELPVSGIFVAIGQVPENTAFAPVASLDERGYLVSGEDCLTKTDGIFVAGDCRTKQIRQITTACGDGAVAALAACRYLDRGKIV